MIQGIDKKDVQFAMSLFIARRVVDAARNVPGRICRNLSSGKTQSVRSSNFARRANDFCNLENFQNHLPLKV